MRLIAAALLAGLALIAGAVVFHALETREDDPYSKAEKIVRAALSVAGIRAVSVSQLVGPFVTVKLAEDNCLLFDVSTTYDADTGPDSFWVTAGEEEGKSIDC